MTYSIVNRIVAAPPEPGHRALFVRTDGTESIELPDLYERAARVASKLRSLGLGPGERIGVRAANRLEWVLLDLAALRLKAVTVGLEPTRFESDSTLLARYDLKLLYTEEAGTAPGVRPIGEVR